MSAIIGTFNFDGKEFDVVQFGADIVCYQGNHTIITVDRNCESGYAFDDETLPSDLLWGIINANHDDDIVGAVESAVIWAHNIYD